MALKLLLFNHKDSSHNPNQGLMVLQIHIWAWVDHIASQPLLHVLLTAAGSHLYWAAPLEALKGEKQWETTIFACLQPNFQLELHAFSGIETLCLMTQQKKLGSSHTVIYGCAWNREKTHHICMFGMTSICSGYKTSIWKMLNGSCVLCQRKGKGVVCQGWLVIGGAFCPPSF